MVENAIQEEQALRNAIEETVDEAVDRAFRKYGRVSRFSWKGLMAILVILALAVTGVYWLEKRNINNRVAPVEDHDLTLENNGIFGFTAADFEEAILGAAARQRLLIVEEQEVYVNTTITDTGFLNWGVFNKQQALTIHGMGQYTIDLTQITSVDISLNENTYELTICIPHAVLHQTNFDPSQTEVGDTKTGWLAFGSIKMTAEQQQEFETAAIQRLEEKLNEEARLKEADRFAKLAAYETYQPIAKAVSPAYNVVIDFQ